MTVHGSPKDSDPARTALDGQALARVAELVQDLGSTLELDEVLSNVGQGIREHIDYDTFAVLLLDELGRELHFRFSVGFPDEVVFPVDRFDDDA